MPAPWELNDWRQGEPQSPNAPQTPPSKRGSTAPWEQERWRDDAPAQPPAEPGRTLLLPEVQPERPGLPPPEDTWLEGAYKWLSDSAAGDLARWAGPPLIEGGANALGFVPDVLLDDMDDIGAWIESAFDPEAIDRRMSGEQRLPRVTPFLKDQAREAGLIPKDYQPSTGQRFVQYTAEGIPGVLALARKFGPAIVQEGVTSLGTILGEDAGQEIATEAGLDPQLGQTIGGVLGGTGVHAVPAASAVATNKLLGQDTSGELYDTAVREGVTPSAGLIGNRQAKRLENFGGIIPFVGQSVHNTQGRQLSQTEQALRGISEALLPPGASLAPDQTTTAQRFREAAARSADNTRARLGADEDSLETAFGPRTLIKTPTADDAFGTLAQRTDPANQRILQGEAGDLDAMKRPVDVPLHNRLTAARDALEQAELEVQNAADPASYQQAVADLRALEQRAGGTRQEIETQIRENLGVPYEQLRDFRTGVGTRTRKAGLTGGQEKQVYSAVSDDVRQALKDKGLEGDWDNLMQEWDQAINARGRNTSEGGYVTRLEKTSQKELPAVLSEMRTALFTNPDAIEMWKKNLDPNDFALFAGDWLFHLGRPKSSTAMGAYGSGQPEFNPSEFATNWLAKNGSGLPYKTKLMLLDNDPDLVKRVDDIAALALEMNRRGQASNPSGTTQMATLGLVGGAALTDLGATLAGVGAGFGFIQTMLTKTLAQATAGRAPTFAERVTQALPGMGVRAYQHEIPPEEQPMPEPSR